MHERIEGALLLPRLAWLGARAPRGTRPAWDRYWSGVQATGDGGDVLWDTDGAGEWARYSPCLRRHFDPTLPILDVGCGNGRFTRLLAGTCPRAVGVDLSPAAVSRAAAESGGVGNVSFHAADLTAPDAAARLRTWVGAGNVFVRGVFHVLQPPARRALAANLVPVVGQRGRLFLTETNFPGGSVAYVRHLGASATRLPGPVQRAVASLPRPGHFGEPELRDCFPAQAWQVLESGPTTIETIPLHGGSGARIPGFYAVLASRWPEPGTSPDEGRP